MSDKTDNKKLFDKLKKNPDPDTFALLYDSHIKQIYRFVYFKVSNHEEAEDITSEVFLKAWHYLREHRDVESFRGLLYRIARNCVIDVYRARAARPEVLIETELEKGDEGAWFKGVEKTLENEAIFSALKKLKQEYQEVITLRYIDELEINEMAEIIGKGTIAVRVTLHRALKKLKIILDQQNKRYVN